MERLKRSRCTTQKRGDQIIYSSTQLDLKDVQGMVVSKRFLLDFDAEGRSARSCQFVFWADATPPKSLGVAVALPPPAPTDAPVLLKSRSGVVGWPINAMQLHFRRTHLSTYSILAI